MHERGVTVHYGFLSCIPILVLLIGGFATGRITEMLIVSTTIGAVIIYKTAFFGEYVKLIYEVLSNGSYQFILILLIGIGAMTSLWEKSGSLSGFRDRLGKWMTTPKRSILITWLLTFVMFIDDYLVLLAIPSSIRKLTDRAGVPREHLAYTLNAMGASICILIPCTSWSAFTITQLEKVGMTFGDYVRAIPYMFFPIASVIVSFLIAAEILPKTGALKAAYARVRSGGPALSDEEVPGAAVVDTEKKEEQEYPPTSLFNFFVPLIVLIAVTILYERSITHGIVAALVCMLIMYKAQKLITVGDFFNTIFDSMKGMAAIGFVVLFAFMIAAENDKMGFAPYVIGTFSRIITPRLLPLVVFIVMTIISFAMGDGWSLMIISMPIFIPMARQMGVSPLIVLGATLSGLNIGVVSCLQSDALFMTYAGTGVPNITQIKTGLPYVVLAGVLSAIAFLIVGFL